MSVLDTLVAAGEAMGATRERERTRICRIVGSLPVAECTCDQQWLEVGIHFHGCMNQAEIAFRARLLDAIVPTVDEGSGTSPLSGVPEPDPSSTAALTSKERQAVGGI